MTSQDIIDLLNQLTDLDSEAIAALIEKRVEINRELAEADIPVVTSTRKTKDGTTPQLGVLGVLQGLVAKDGQKIIALYDGEKLDSFRLKPITA